MVVRLTAALTVLLAVAHAPAHASPLMRHGFGTTEQDAGWESWTRGGLPGAGMTDRGKATTGAMVRH